MTPVERFRTLLRIPTISRLETELVDWRDMVTVIRDRVQDMVNKGLTHRNKAARHKSRLNKAIKALSADGPAKASSTTRTRSTKARSTRTAAAKTPASPKPASPK